MATAPTPIFMMPASASSLPGVEGAKERGEVMLSRQNLRVARLIVPPNAPLKEHRSPDDVVIVVVRGVGMITVDGTTRRAKAGDAFDLRPGVPHSVSAHDEMELIVVHARLAG